jgi:hypothetical protein
MKWARHAALKGERRSAYRMMVRKPEGKRPLGRLGLRWEDLHYMEWESWTGLIGLRVVTGGGHL